jgi:Zn-dependent protease
MLPIQQKGFLLLWLVIPVGAGVLYPYLKSEPKYLEGLLTGLLIYVLFFSVVVHELSHGLAANFCGDPTAREAGRLTFNPFKHVSLLGSILVPLGLYFMKAAAVFGWARPVPFNPLKLRQYPRDQVMLAVAGPLSNFASAYLCLNLYMIIGFVFNRVFPQSPVSLQMDLFTPLMFKNVPFEAVWFVVFEVLSFGIVINVGLGVFNLIPFPPLDGSWILKALLPKKAAVLFGKFQLVGFILLLLALQFQLLQIFFYPVIIIVILFQSIANICLGMG